MSMRKQPRVDCDFILNKFQTDGTNICRATNISLSGMRLQRLLDPYMKIDEECRFEVELPGDDGPITIGAKKVWEDPQEFGVRFTSISHTHFVRLRAWLQGESLVSRLPAFR